MYFQSFLMVFIFLILLTGCPMVQEIVEVPLSEGDIWRLQNVQDQMLEGNTIEVEIDRKILEAVKQMTATLKPEYKRHILRKHRLGFLEVSDIDREHVSLMHNYLTEKTLTFSFLQAEIATHFNIVERFLLKDILRELSLESLDSTSVIDQRLAKGLGRIYGVDVIETGVVTESMDFIDINLRMIETRRGRIIAVGSVKIQKTKPVREWLEGMTDVSLGWPR